MNYRYDSRNEAQFKADIKSTTLEERSLFELWLTHVKGDTGKRPKFEDMGCGKDGAFLETNKVSMSPDFKVDGYGEIEVKFSKKKLTGFFHLKARQVEHYKKINAAILMINGSREKVPQFTMLTHEALEKISKNCEKVEWRGFGLKMAYKIPVNMFIWRNLK